MGHTFRAGPVRVVWVWLDICTKQSKRILVCCIYKSPFANYNDFNTELKGLFDKFQFNTKHVYVCGDFNMHLMKDNENRGYYIYIIYIYNIYIYNIPYFHCLS